METLKKLAAQFERVRTHGIRHKRQYPQAYLDRLAEDRARTEAEWDELLASTHKEAQAQRNKVMEKLRLKGILSPAE
jgi:hypothetical protein